MFFNYISPLGQSYKRHYTKLVSLPLQTEFNLKIFKTEGLPLFLNIRAVFYIMIFLILNKGWKVLKTYLYSLHLHNFSLVEIIWWRVGDIEWLWVVFSSQIILTSLFTFKVAVALHIVSRVIVKFIVDEFPPYCPTGVISFHNSFFWRWHFVSQLDSKSEK
jgi:hypothetical protein